MSSEKNEFTRMINLGELGAKEKRIAIVAEGAELTQLAKRLNISELSKLEAVVHLLDEGRAKGISMVGTLMASGTQPCITTLKPVAFDIQEKINIRFLSETRITPEMEEENIYTLNSEDLEPIPEDDLLDFGELVAQYLALSIDLYPKAEGAALDSAAVKGVTFNEPLVEKPSPFADLAKLLDKT